MPDFVGGFTSAAGATGSATYSTQPTEFVGGYTSIDGATGVAKYPAGQTSTVGASTKAPIARTKPAATKKKAGQSVAVQVIKERGALAESSALQGQDEASSGQGAAGNFIRRPTRGIQIKEETFATIRLVALTDGKNRLLIDAGSRRLKDRQDGGVVNGKRMTDIYSNFLLQQVQEDRSEKFQILETFGEPYIFLFGQRPRMITFSGILINSFDFNWEAEWWENYDKYLRGTQCVEKDARVFISYDQRLVGGYIVSANAAQNTMEPSHINFSFQIFVTTYTNFSNIGMPDALPGYSISPRYPKYQDWADSKQKSLNDSLSTEQRPVLIPLDYEPPTVGGFTPGEPPSLFSSFESSVKKVQDAWSKASSVVNSTLRGVSGFLNGDAVRVPVGFAGSIAYADDAKIELVDLNENSLIGESMPVRYTVFSDNEDEYVGRGDHYGSSDIRIQGKDGERWFGSTTITYDQSLVDKAVSDWKKNGYDITQQQLGPIAQGLVSKGLGIVATVLNPVSVAGEISNAIGSAAKAPGAQIHGAQAVGLVFPEG